MIIVLCILSIIMACLYYKELKKGCKYEKSYEELEEKYSRVISEKIDLSNNMNVIKEEYNKEIEMGNEIKKLHERTRTLKHDMKNHMIVLTSFLNDSEYDKAKSYLSKISDNLNKMYTYIETGNSLLNYIINSKLQLAKEKNIDVKAEIENLSFEKIGSVDFSALLNNLLDNAIEGSEDTYNKEIVVNILRKRGYDTILIKNKINKSILKDNPNLKSTKKEKEVHGYGLKQVKSIVEKYDGMIDIYEEDGFFCVYVVYPY